MSYDPYAEIRRQQAEALKRQEQQFHDKILRDIKANADPTPPTPPSETATGLIGVVLLLLYPVAWVAGLVWRRDIGRPWSRFRKGVALVAVAGAAVGWTWYNVVGAAEGGLGWILGFLSTSLLVVALAPRTVLVVGTLVAILGIYVEFFAP